MNDQPLVSVIVPAYNAAPFLVETLRSIQTQTYRHLEVVVVDDGSTDGTHEIAASFANSDPRFIVMSHAKNAGVSAARNTGLSRANGEWIAFQDADDVWLPEKTESQLQLASGNPRVNFLFTNYALWDGNCWLKVMYTRRKSFPSKNPHQRADLFG